MKVVVNMQQCESNAICSGLVPEVFEVTDDDLLIVIDENPGEELRERLEQAVRSCPKQAISLQ